MRILMASMTFPDDLRVRVHGVFKRFRMFVDALKDLGELEMLFFVESRIDVSPASVERYRHALSGHYGTDLRLRLVHRRPPAPQTRWEWYGPGTFDAYRQHGFRWAGGLAQTAAIDEALDSEPLVLFVHRLGPMAALRGVARPLPPTVFDLDDIEHLALARNIGQPPTWPAKRLRYLHLPALWLAERRAIAAAERTFVCSEKDRDYLARTMRARGVTVIPNAITMPEPCGPAPQPTVMFIGVLSYAPNRNAADWLVSDIWPAVRKLVPDARLVIAGSHAEEVPGYPGSEADGVTFTGFVDDLDELYESTRVVAVPIRAGGGTRIKIIEASGYGRPVVSTPIGAEGLGLQDGEQILLREDAESFARALADLLSDEEKGRRVGTAAREAVLERYDRGNVVEQIRSEIRSAIGR